MSPLALRLLQRVHKTHAGRSTGKWYCRHALTPNWRASAVYDGFPDASYKHPRVIYGSEYHKNTILRFARTMGTLDRMASA